MDKITLLEDWMKCGNMWEIFSTGARVIVSSASLSSLSPPAPLSLPPSHHYHLGRDSVALWIRVYTQAMLLVFIPQLYYLQVL